LVDAFTISSNNYLGMTSVFVDSYLHHHPDATVYVCLVDRPHSRVNYKNYAFEIIPAEDLNIPAFYNFAFKYDILELNTAVKPFVFKYLRDHHGLDRAFYFDPDILIHDRLIALEKALDSHQAVLTPHLTMPLDNICRPPERVIGMCGIYNLGFAGLRLDEKTEDFLDWWCDRLYRYCINDLSNGMFVDQSWMDFAPAYLASVAIMRDPIYNIAYWNLPNRRPRRVRDHWEIKGHRVGFFHFSGVDPRELDAVSKHQDRFSLFDRPELRPLFEEYAELVESSGHHRMRDIPYFYHHFRETDIPIPRFVRTTLMEVDPEGRRWKDPFDTEGEDSYLDWLIDIHPCHSSILNRAALDLWNARPDLQAAFPGLPDANIEPFLDWYLGGGAEQAGLHRIFFEGLERARAEHSNPGFLDEETRFRSIDLSHPGEIDLCWLNERADEFPGGPLLNRCALLLHRTRPDLAAAYPELDERGRRGLIYWLCRFGPEVLGIDRRLLAPLFSQLSLKSRIGLRLRGTGLRTGTFETPVEKSETPQPDRSDEAQESFLLKTADPRRGMNVLGCFEGVCGGRSPARALVETFEKKHFPVLGVSLDHQLPDLMNSSLIRYPSGVPFPASVLCEPPEHWPAIIRNLPLSLRIGHPLIGYSMKKVSLIPEDALEAVDMLWLPTEDLLDPGIDIPQYVIPPDRIDVTPAQLPDFHVPAGKFVIAAEGDWSQPGDRRYLSMLIDWIRNLSPDMKEKIFLLLLTGPDGRQLESEVAYLPIKVFCFPFQAEGRKTVLKNSQAVIDLDLDANFSFLIAEAVWESVPVICRDDRGLKTVLDSDSAWILPGNDDTESLYEILSARIIEIIDSPVEARRKTRLALDRAEKAWRFRFPGILEEDLPV